MTQVPGGPGGPIRREDLPAFPAAVLTTQGSYWRLSPAFARVRSWLDAAGVQATDHAVTLFYDDPSTTPPESCRYAVAFPLGPETAAQVRATLPPTGPDGPAPPALPDIFEVKDFAATPAAVVEYEGPAADSPALYARLEAWIHAHRLVPSGAPRERYIAEPGTLSKGMLHVEVQQPLRD